MIAVSHASDASQIWVIVASALIVAFVTWGTRHLAKKEKQRSEDMKNLVAVVGKVNVALVGEEAGPFNPRPVPGLVKIVDDHGSTISRIDSFVTTLDGKVNQILAGTNSLVADSVTNQGHSMRDAIDRVETEQSRVRQEKRKEG
jgi:hypothetical protein